MSKVASIDSIPRPSADSFRRHRWQAGGSGIWRLQLDCGHSVIRTYRPTIGHPIECPDCNQVEVAS